MTNLTDALHIPDTQSERDERHLPIQRVGIKDLSYPLQLNVAGVVQSTAAQWDLDVALAGGQEGHAHVALHRLAGCAGRAARRAQPAPAPCADARQAGRQRRPHRGALQFFLRKRAPVSGLPSLLDYQGRWIAETRWRRHLGVGRGRRAGEDAVPLLEGDLRLRRAQPALARDDPRRNAAAHRMARTGALRRGPGLQRAVADAQARGREVGHRARLREPQVRRGPGARRGAAR